MSRFVRQSKYRHVYGQQAKKEECFDNVKISASAWDTDLCAVNPRYMAVNCQTTGGGAFVVVPLNRPGKIPDIYPLVRGHSAPVLDTAWNPFNDQVIASAGEDSKVQITKINDDDLLAAWTDGVEVQDIKPLPLSLSHGGRKVGNVAWHPTASGILASASNDIRLWDVEQQTAAITLQAHPDMVQSFAFNSTGALLATTCKDKKLRLFDVRASTAPVQTAESHTGIKGSRVCWLGSHDRIVTTGFSRMSDRQVFLWNAGAIDKPLKQLTIDTSSGTLMPFWSQNDILFLAGKGDGNVRYYEYENDDLIYLTEYKSSDPQRGMTFLPRRGLNVSECEIARAYKVVTHGIDPISFIVPRKSETFQADIYPPAPGDKPALSAAEFLGGKTSAPVYIDLESRQTTSAPVTPATPATPVAPQSAKQPERQASTASVQSPKSPSNEAASTVLLPPSSVAVPGPEPPASKEPSPVKESVSPPSPVVASPATSRQASTSDAPSSAEVEKLKSDNARLERELAEALTTIRKLEIKVEKYNAAHKRAQEAYADV